MSNKYKYEKTLNPTSVPARFDLYKEGNVLTIDKNGYVVQSEPQGGGGEGGTTDYNDLDNKPQINGVTLQGNKTADDLKLATPSDVSLVQDHLDDLSDTVSSLSSDVQDKASRDLSDVSLDGAQGTILTVGESARIAYSTPTQLKLATDDLSNVEIPQVQGTKYLGVENGAIATFSIPTGTVVFSKEIILTNAYLQTDGTLSTTQIGGYLVRKDLVDWKEDPDLQPYMQNGYAFWIHQTGPNGLALASTLNILETAGTKITNSVQTYSYYNDLFAYCNGIINSLGSECSMNNNYLSVKDKIFTSGGIINWAHPFNNVPQTQNPIQYRCRIDVISLNMKEPDPAPIPTPIYSEVLPEDALDIQGGVWYGFQPNFDIRMYPITTKVVVPSNVNAIGANITSQWNPQLEVLDLSQTSISDLGGNIGSISVKELRIPATATQYNSGCFGNLANCEAIYFYGSVKFNEESIGQCPNLKDMYFSKNASDWKVSADDDLFSGLPSGGNLWGPKEKWPFFQTFMQQFARYGLKDWNIVQNPDTSF